MDKNNILGIMANWEYVFRCESFSTMDKNVHEMASAIAAQHEAEITEATRDWVALRDEAQAQVAMMAQALQNLVRIRNHVPSEAARRDNRTDGGLASISRSLRYEISDIDEAWERVEQALSAAPRVLASLRLQEGYGGGMELGHRRYASDENEWPWVAVDVPPSDPIDLAGAHVLFFADEPECSGQGEPSGDSALQEKSKATMPDDEQSQSSEQASQSTYVENDFAGWERASNEALSRFESSLDTKESVAESQQPSDSTEEMKQEE